MSHHNTGAPVIIDKAIVIEGIETILDMFETIGQSRFPRNIMTFDYNGFFQVDSLEQMFEAFERAQFKDCRISAYPPIKVGIMQIPNISLLDVDLDYKTVMEKTKADAKLALKRKVNRLLKLLQIKYNISNFMVMWTGNGYHILVPFGFDRPFEHLQEFSKYLPQLPSNTSISEQFLYFAKRHLSDNKADAANIPNFASMFLRVPGTINTKTKYGASMEIVRIEHKWDPNNKCSIPTFACLHSSTDLMYEFMGHLDDKVLEYKIKLDNQSKQNDSSQIQNQRQKQKIDWIETLWNTPVTDCRKRIIWLILPQYATKIRNMGYVDAFNWIKDWASRCNMVRQLDFNMDGTIDYYLKAAMKKDHGPLGFQKLESLHWKMDGPGNMELHQLLTRK